MTELSVPVGDAVAIRVTWPIARRTGQNSQQWCQRAGNKLFRLQTKLVGIGPGVCEATPPFPPNYERVKLILSDARVFHRGEGPSPRSAPDTNRLYGSLRDRDNRAELSPAWTDRLITRVLVTRYEPLTRRRMEFQ